MEQLYSDFTTKLLPKIQEGLVITKDYFLSLFGRYIKYLIVSDSLMIVLGVTLFVLCLFAVKWLEWKAEEDDWNSEFRVFYIFFIIPVMISLVITISSIDNLLKDIYVPEIRIYQELKDIKN